MWLSAKILWFPTALISPPLHMQLLVHAINWFSYLHIFCSKKVWRPETVNLLLCKYMCSIITTLSELELCRTQTRIKEKPIIPLWIIGQLQFITSYVYPGLQPLNSHSNLSSPPLTLFHSFFLFILWAKLSSIPSLTHHVCLIDLLRVQCSW